MESLLKKHIHYIFFVELLLKRSIPVSKADVFNNAHQILPLELTAASNPLKYFAVSKNGGNYITIVKYNVGTRSTMLHQVLPEPGLLNMAVFYGFINPLVKRKFFAAGGKNILLFLFNLHLNRKLKIIICN